MRELPTELLEDWSEILVRDEHKGYECALVLFKHKHSLKTSARCDGAVPDQRWPPYGPRQYQGSPQKTENKAR